MVNELAAVMEELGGESAVGRSVHTTEDMSRAIREGFPHPVVGAFVKASGLTLQEVASSLDLSLRSLQRRRHEGRLARFESDRLYRLARLMVLADYFLGDHDRAVEWFKRPNRSLGGAVPLELVDTELGARQVEHVLGWIGYGGIS
jgi:putative toxin-antitoxin system antitoxin component (TIGR02293 family)